MLISTTASRRVVVIAHAETDRAVELSRTLLAHGTSVAVTARQAGALVRIIAGHNADQVVAIAADLDDDRQRALVLARVEERLGPVAVIIDGRTGSPWSRSTIRELPRAV